MNILLTGSTGFLGSRTLEVLKNYDEVNKIIATGRTLKKHNTINDSKIEYKLGNLNDNKFVASLFSSKVDYVINCASLSSPWGDYETFYNANVLTQKHLIQQASKNNIKRFIYISTPSIYQNLTDRYNIKEEDPLPPKLINNYSISKYEAEKLLIESNLEFVILRPRALVGKGDTVIMPRLIKIYHAGRLKVIGNGKNLAELTSVLNVVDAIWLAVTTEKQNCNTVYNITNGKPVLLWEKINLIFQKLGYKKLTKNISYAFLLKIATLLEWKAKLSKSKKEPVLTKHGVGVLGNSMTINIDKAKEKLKYVPKQSIDDAIDDFVEWYQKVEL